MSEGFINVTEGSGKKLHTNVKTIGADAQHDEYVLIGEPFLAAYQVSCTSISAATANSHLMTINAGGTLNVYIRRIIIYQFAPATTGAMCEIDLLRTTTAAPTGGTSFTPIGFDSGDGGAGATAMTLPTVKATEGNPLGRYTAYFSGAVAAAANYNQPILDMNFDNVNHMKAPKIAAGTTNGIAIKNLTAMAAATVRVNIWFQEANF